MAIKDLETVDGPNGPVIERFNVEGLMNPVGAYKHVTAIDQGTGYRLEISGMIPLVNGLNGPVVQSKNSPEVQSIVVIRNIGRAISGAAEHLGSDLHHGTQSLELITDSTVLLTTMDHFAMVNKAYENEGMPGATRAAYAVAGLPLQDRGVLVEIRANAFLPKGYQTSSGHFAGIRTTKISDRE